MLRFFVWGISTFQMTSKLCWACPHQRYLWSISCRNKKAVLSQRWLSRCALWPMLWKFLGVPAANFPDISLDTPFKVVDFGTNRKRVCDLVISCRLAPFRTSDQILQVFCAPEWPHPCSTLILGVFPLNQIAHVGVSQSRGLKLFSREIIFDEFQPMWSRRYLNVTDCRVQTIYYTIAIPRICTKVHRAVKYYRYGTVRYLWMLVNLTIPGYSKYCTGNMGRIEPRHHTCYNLALNEWLIMKVGALRYVLR